MGRIIKLLRTMIFLVKYIFTITVILACILVIIIFFTDNANLRNKRQSSSQLQQSKFVNSRHRLSFDDIVRRKNRFNITGQDLLVLLHIQKTGGTTFERHLVHNLNIVNPCFCNEDKRRCLCSRSGDHNSTKTIADVTWLISRFSTGWACGLHADWTQLSDCLRNLPRLFFITFLRHPLHRFISEFRHVQRGATWKASKSHCEHYDTQLCYNNKTSWFDVSLEEFLKCPNNMAINRQTRMLANHKLVGCPSDGEPNSGNRDDLMLTSAIDNLKSIAFFGLCERQRASQIVFEKTFDLKFKQDFKQSDDNKTKVFIERLPNDIVERILKINHLDMKLYEYATNLFHSRCDQISNECKEFY